ncbi:18801_t:CDS:1, partial [Racocetra persica]
MSLEKYSFNIIQFSAAFFSISNNLITTYQDLLTYFRSLQDTIAVIQSSLIQLKKKTKEYTSGAS